MRTPEPLDPDSILGDDLGKEMDAHETVVSALSLSEGGDHTGENPDAVLNKISTSIYYSYGIVYFLEEYRERLWNRQDQVKAKVTLENNVVMVVFEEIDAPRSHRRRKKMNEKTPILTMLHTSCVAMIEVTRKIQLGVFFFKWATMGTVRFYH